MTRTAAFPRWLLRRPSTEARARIFCFPYSGMGASMFNRWPGMIGDVEVCRIQLPHRENRIRDPHYGTYEALSDMLADFLLPYLDRPSVFFGHCAGALPAFETVRRLAERGQSVPGRLVVSAQVAPHHCPHDRFLDLTDEELSDELAQLAVARGGEAHPALIELSLAVLRRDLAANRVYRLAEPVRVPSPISVLHWSDDPEVTMDQLRGWQHYAEDVTFTELPGGHYAFLTAPGELLAELTEDDG